MKHRLKGLLALVLSLVMVFALATNAWAAVKIGGIELTSGVAFDGAQGTATYDDTTKTLTLNGFEHECSGNGIESNENLTLQLLGDNKVESNSGGAGIFVDGGTLTIDGTGSLTASGTGSGIYAGNVTIESGKVTATGTNGDGISASVKVTISGGNVTAEGGWDGIYAGDTVSISDGEVNAKGVYDGIIASDKVTISGGNVTATGTGDDGRGISAYDVSIENATVTAAGSATDDGSGNVTYGGEYGIYSSHTGNSSGGEVVIKNSTVTAKAGADGTGIRVEGVIGETIIQNSTVDIGCETGINSNYVAILADSSVTIKSTDKAISCSGLSFADVTDPALSDSTWYKWSTNGTAFTLSTATELTKEITAGTSTLYVVPLSANTNPYPPFIYNPTPTPEPEKVDSAKTFDGGIGLYVTMSVLSATGSAFLFKKKD